MELLKWLEPESKHLENASIITIECVTLRDGDYNDKT